MADLVRYTPDNKGTGKLLVDPQMHRLIGRAAEAAKLFAISISPDQPPYGEGYIANFEVETGLETTLARSPRATAHLRNTSDYAAAVEWRWGHHVLGRTVDFIEHWTP